MFASKAAWCNLQRERPLDTTAAPWGWPSGRM
jgi:hypothetical protein